MQIDGKESFTVKYVFKVVTLNNVLIIRFIKKKARTRQKTELYLQKLKVSNTSCATSAIRISHTSTLFIFVVKCFPALQLHSVDLSVTTTRCFKKMITVCLSDFFHCEYKIFAEQLFAKVLGKSKVPQEVSLDTGKSI